MDDGWSGANFDRPSFTEMMEGVENGEIKTVIVKDLSRLGRNYLQVGYFTEIVFPKKNVRFIAINDGVDSEQGEKELSGFRNYFNEWLVRDMSKKIKAVFKSKGISGKPITSNIPYGYVKGPDGFFVIDEETAPTVKLIFDLFLAGNGPTKIARVLTERDIPTPGTVEYRRTGSTRRYYPEYPCRWFTNTVCHILERREYIGDTVNCKTEKVSYKVKVSVLTPVKVLDNVVVVSAGHSGIEEHSHTAEVKADGSLYTWGYNRYGQLGDGTTADHHEPVKVLDNVVAVSAGPNHTAAVTSDGSLYTWGSNSWGELGDGTTENRLTPVKIMDGVSDAGSKGRVSLLPALPREYDGSTLMT